MEVLEVFSYGNKKAVLYQEICNEHGDQVFTVKYYVDGIHLDGSDFITGDYFDAYYRAKDAIQAERDWNEWWGTGRTWRNDLY